MLSLQKWLWQTSSPADSNHDQQAVVVFAVSLSDASQHLPCPGHLLHPWQQQPERQQGSTAVHQVHGTVKHQIPAETHTN